MIVTGYIGNKDNKRQYIPPSIEFQEIEGGGALMQQPQSGDISGGNIGPGGGGGGGNTERGSKHFVFEENLFENDFFDTNIDMSF